MIIIITHYGSSSATRGPQKNGQIGSNMAAKGSDVQKETSLPL